MKKIAFFVEGPTEADFVKAYLKEVTSQRGLITVKEFTGGKSSTRVYTQTYSDNAGSDYMVDIYVSGADNRVNSDILDNLPSLKSLLSDRPFSNASSYHVQCRPLRR